MLYLSPKHFNFKNGVCTARIPGSHENSLLRYSLRAEKFTFEAEKLPFRSEKKTFQLQFYKLGNTLVRMKPLSFSKVNILIILILLNFIEVIFF